MKAFIRVIVVVAVVFIIIGLAIAVSVGVIKGPAFLDRINDGNYVTSEGQNTIEMNMADFDRIRVEILNANITFKAVEGETATIVYDVFRGDKIEELKGTDFGLDEENTDYWFLDITKWFRFGLDQRDIEISIPKDSMPALKINVVNGKISGGNVKLKETSITATNASINVSDVVADGDFAVNNTNGSIIINNVTAKDIIKCVNTNGKIENQALTSNKVEMINTNGKVSGLQLKAGDIRLINTNGSLEASVYGVKEDYNITLNTTNGSFRVDGQKYDRRVSLNSTKENKITFNTTNGGGNLMFISQ